MGPWTQPSWPRCEDVPVCKSLTAQLLPPKDGAREIGDLNNGRKLLCLRVRWSPALLPTGVITGDVLRFLVLRAKASHDNPHIVSYAEVLLSDDSALRHGYRTQD